MKFIIDSTGGAKQTPYNGAQVVPAGLDGKTKLSQRNNIKGVMPVDTIFQHFSCAHAGTSQFEPQAAGLGPNGKLGSMYGGMCNFISFKSL